MDKDKRIDMLENALLDILNDYGYNYAMSSVENACKILKHPLKDANICYCGNKQV